MSGIAFKSTPCGRNSFYRRHASAVVDADHHMTIGATRHGDSVQVCLSDNMMQSYMNFTAEQARAVAAELMACADALQGRA
ncbi:hypothetical protein [Acidovorax sp. 59]|uniref:hypothetical protein n=2 Tax=unclassified Acidovorax TaxID=2684926 RepID=UPI000C17E2B9|nr:hypothetical protein [Acidovorax sp. 59]PIF16571.1 hypothetical protein CLU87_0472 [Acidovorax sp. 59]PKW04404.1 hypothetical protein CLU89_4089 [Acidovorax sp. 30]